MARVKVPPMVAAALAQFELSAEDLASYEITEVDVFLKMKNKVRFRVEISSLPESVLADSVLAAPAPETTAKVGAKGRVRAKARAR